MYNNAIFVTKLEEIPKQKHWAIFFNGSYLSPGYDPGEPSYSSPKIDYRAYLSKEDWEAAIKDLLTPKQWKTTEMFSVAEINPIEVKFNLELKL